MLKRTVLPLTVTGTVALFTPTAGILATSSMLLSAARRIVPDHATVRGRPGKQPVFTVILPAQLPSTGLSVVPGGLMTSVIARHTVRDVSSPAQMPKVDVPGATGVPVRFPDESIDNPIGRNVPDCWVNRSVPCPPLAVNRKL